jgi:CBS domain containing-hemolysin-like protein
MVESGVGRIPIVDPESRRVVGIISRQDLLKVRLQQEQGERIRSRGKPLPFTDTRR